MENTVEQILAGSVQDDAAQAQQENTQPLSEFMNEQKTQTQPEAPAPKEPGWIKQRVSAAVDKAVREHPLITVHEQEVTDIPPEGTVIIASGPLSGVTAIQETRRATRNAPSEGTDTGGDATAGGEPNAGQPGGVPPQGNPGDINNAETITVPDAAQAAAAAALAKTL